MFKKTMQILAVLLVLAVVVSIIETLAGFKAHASTLPTVHIGAGTSTKSACTRTSPEYRFHAGGTSAVLHLGSPQFTAVKTPGGYQSPYLVSGYDEGISTSYTCSGYGGALQKIPVAIGKQGDPRVTLRTVTSSNFGGDTGFDIWYTPGESCNTYTCMTSGGNNTTEEMLWTSRAPDLGYWIATAHGRSIVEGGIRWYIVPQKLRGAAKHNWNRVFFIRDDSHRGTVSVSNLRLDPFATWMIKAGYLNAHDTQMSIDAGGEMTAGTLSVGTYVLAGLPLSRA